MKKKTKIIITVYIIIALIATINLLTYNKYNITQIGNKVFIKLNKKLDNYKKGTLLIATTKDKYIANDNVFYCELKDEKCNLKYGRITTMMGDAPLINGKTVSKKLLVATDENIKKIPLIGSIMNFFESRIIYLCLIVIPILIATIYEIKAIKKELKNIDKKTNKKK